MLYNFSIPKYYNKLVLPIYLENGYQLSLLSPTIDDEMGY